MSPVIVSVPDQRLADDIGPVDGAEIIVWAMDAASPRPRIDIVVPPYLTQSRAMPHLQGLDVRLVQGQSIGFDGVAELLPPGTAYANAASVHEASTAELAVGLAVAMQRRIDVFARDTAEGRWAPGFAMSLADRRVLLLGYGGVGKAVAARLAPFEVELTVVASRARDEDGLHIHGIDELASLLPSAEIVVVTLPGGPQTHHLIAEAELAALPDGALLINVGRGPIVDTEALVPAVRAGRLRVALDVTDPEPLPEAHPLWGLDGTLITPHVGGASSAMRPRIAALVRRQAERMVAGEEPVNVVLRG